MRAWAVGVVAFVVLGIIWQCSAGLGLYNVRLLPPPSDSLAAFLDTWKDGTLLSDLGDSAARYIPGFLIGSIIGIMMGVITGVSHNAGYVFNPLLHYLRSIPPVALIPFILVLFGIDDIGKVSLVAWAVMFPVWLSTQVGIKQVPREYIQAAKIFGSDGFRRVLDVWLPYATPHIISGLRIAVATGIFALAAAEMFAASSGIGFRIVYSHQLFQTDTMVAMILFIGIVALLADTLLLTLSKKVSPWEEQ